MEDKQPEVIKDERFKISLKQSAKGSWYCGEVRAKANNIEELETAIKQLKAIAEKQTGGVF